MIGEMVKGSWKTIIIAAVVIVQIGLACYVTWSALQAPVQTVHTDVPQVNKNAQDGENETGIQEIYKRILLNSDEIDACEWRVQPRFFRYLTKRRSKKLTFFKASRTADDSILQYLKDLNVTHLVLADCCITARCLKDVGCLNSLEFLEINNLHSQPDDWRPVVALKNLIALRANNCGLTDETMKIFSTHKFQFLALSANPLVTDAGTAFLSHENLAIIRLAIDQSITDRTAYTLSQMPSLETVELIQTRVTDKGLLSLARLKNLQLLNLAKTSVTDLGLRSFMPPPKLQLLVLRDCKKVSPECVREFQSRHPSCQVQFDDK